MDDHTVNKEGEAIAIENGDWESIFNTVTDCITVHDRDFNIILMNQSARKMLGLQIQDQIPLTKCFQYYHGTDKPPAACLSCQTLQTGKPSTTEIFEPFLNKHLEIVAIPRFAGDCQLVGLIHVVRDITNRKTAEKELRESEEKYRSLASTVDELILVDRSCRYLFANQIYLDRFGSLKDSVIGRRYEEFHSEEASKIFTEAVKQVFTTGRPHRDEWLGIRSAKYWLRTFSPVKHSDGSITAITIASKDITDRKRAEEALRESEKAATQLAKENELIAEIGRIISSTLNIEEVYERFAEKVREAIPFDHIVVNTINWRDYTRTARYATGDLLPGNYVGKIFSLAGTRAEHVMLTKSSLVINSRNREDMLQKFPGKLLQLGDQSMMMVPLISKDAVIGVLSIHSAKVDAYSENDLRLAEKVGLQIAGAIANAGLFLERQQAETELRESEEKYRSLASTVDALFLVDRDCRFLFANESFLAFYGPQMDSILGRKYAEFHDADASRVFAEAIKYVFETGNPYKDEWVGRRSGNCLLRTFSPVMNAEGSISAVTVTSKDITDRMLAEESLKESESKYRTLAEQALVGVSIVQDGVFKYVNSKFADMHGYKIDELLDNFSHLDLICPDYRQPAQDRIKELLAGNLKDVHNEIKKFKKDGEIIQVETYGIVGSFQGKPARFGFSLDITDRKRVEEQRQSMEERLYRAEKMEALGQLAGGVAHDLNNVLGVLSGYSEMLLDRIPAGNPLREYAAHIFRSSEKGAAIIEDLLTLARRGVVVARVIDFNKIVLNFLATPECAKLQAYHSQVKFKTDLEQDLLHIKGSPVHLEKTVMNLVSNAAEAILGSGEVTIRTENRYLDKAIQGYDQVEQGEYVVLTVSDSGGGISAADADKIFEPFYTKKSMGRSGTGLGLAIVWGTVKDHKGYIDVQSIEGRGTTFTLYFPVTREIMGDDAQKLPIEQYLGQGESVLVVDDVPEQRQVATMLLTRLGYRVAEAAGGEEAVTYLQSNKVDILVLDMIMAPGIDGLETYRRVLENNPHQKAIIVSGFSETERVRRTQELGAGAYVKKPYTIEKIGVAIRDELMKAKN